MMYTQQSLIECMDKAYSYESRAGWDADNLSTKYVGSVRNGNRIYNIFVDTNGNYWYKTHIDTEDGIVSEYEAIFGHKEKIGGIR